MEYQQMVWKKNSVPAMRIYNIKPIDTGAPNHHASTLGGHDFLANSIVLYVAGGGH